MRLLSATLLAFGLALGVAAPADARYCDGVVDTNCTWGWWAEDTCLVYVDPAPVISGSGSVCVYKQVVR